MDWKKEDDERWFAYSRPKYDKIIKIISTTSSYTFNSPQRQCFALPPDVISRIFYQKKSCKILIKLYQTCKYFFKKQPILLLLYESRCHRDSVYSRSRVPHREFNFNKNVWFWFNEELYLNETYPSIINRIYWCTIKKLTIYSSILSLAELKHLECGSKIENLDINDSNIIDSNGNMAPLNAILELFSNCRYFNYRNKNEPLAKETLLAMNQLQLSQKFIRFSISPTILAYSFDASLLLKFILKNINLDSRCSIYTGRVIAGRQEIVMKLKNALQKVFPEWDGKQPSIYIA